MDPKQQQLQDVVIAYFGQRGDARVEPAGKGLYRVELLSETAQTDFGGQRRISLVFDADRAYENPDGELIIPSHPFLEVIRNDLERDVEADPRLAEAHIPLQLLDPDGQIAVPQLVFTGGNPDISVQLAYHPTIVLTYLIIYEHDERTDHVVRLCYDGVTGVPRADLLLRLPDLALRDGRPPNARLAKNIPLATLLGAGRTEIEARIRSDVEVLHRDLRTELGLETRRLTEYYEKQAAVLRASANVEREQLRSTLEKDVAELERKLELRVQVRLLSVLRLWWPSASYQLDIPGHHGNFVVKDVRYHSQAGRAALARCEHCGNEVRYDLCVAGKHVLCGGRCSTGLEHCTACGDTFCRDHGARCTGCSEPVCINDQQGCAYGHHEKSDVYCPKCLVASFEGQPLCTHCREDCGLCGRAFPHEYMVTCRIGGERVCYGHTHSPDSFTCDECSSPACAVHGLRTADGTWVCQDHAGIAGCCQRTFGLSRLVTCCCDSAEILCPDHRVTCASCRGAVCEQHRFALHLHEHQFVCATCRQTCALCPGERSYLPFDLGACQVCGRPVCHEHAKECTVCGRVVCTDHLQLSAAGEPLCPDHARAATCCERVFPTTSLVPCSNDPSEALCPDHRVTCASCGGAVCDQHRFALHLHEHQFVCATCRQTCALCPGERSYLPFDLGACQVCGRPVCHEHAKGCTVCGRVVCTDHLQLSAAGEPLCPDHARAATCCERVFPTTSLVPCSNDPSEALCPDHRRKCLSCGLAVCYDHSTELYQHPSRFVCQNCQRSCSLCPGDWHYVPGDLALCHTCHQPVCSEHRHTCVIGGEVVCDTHVRVSVNGEALCEVHAGSCTACQAKQRPAIYRVDSLTSCAVCRTTICTEHRSLCQVCEAAYLCPTHVETQPTCASCGRVSCGTQGCSPTSYTCPSCGMAYCHYCRHRSGRCITCASLQPSQPTKAWLKFLKQFENSRDRTIARLAGEMGQSPGQLAIWTAANNTYQVVVARYNPQWFQIWKTRQQLRVVVAKTGQIKRVQLESVSAE